MQATFRFQTQDLQNTKTVPYFNNLFTFVQAFKIQLKSSLDLLCFKKANHSQSKHLHVTGILFSVSA